MKKIFEAILSVPGHYRIRLIIFWQGKGQWLYVIKCYKMSALHSNYLQEWNNGLALLYFVHFGGQWWWRLTFISRKLMMQKPIRSWHVLIYYKL
ncbi:hypothetical protein AQUCO_07800028v1 [Aquilegia coerulea]|uniref:Uncharacterized protein n=1 Tax=Aquilegia coerulea TaxID=218851 RepID=A0A2G5C7Y3_AQUCA|nr:hypothetical protein AQUCO_07800028v1 [Aquilegia coerulea]